MKQQIFRHQVMFVLSMFALLKLASLYDKWQPSILESFYETFEFKYFYLNLWFTPIATLLFAICWLMLLRFTIAYPHKATASLFLIVGVCILFYTSVVMTLEIVSKMGISVNYFGDSLLFYSGATVAAIGVLGLLRPLQKQLP